MCQNGLPVILSAAEPSQYLQLRVFNEGFGLAHSWSEKENEDSAVMS